MRYQPWAQLSYYDCLRTEINTFPAIDKSPLDLVGKIKPAFLGKAYNFFWIKIF